VRSRRLVFSAKVSALAVGSDSATRGRTFLITGGRYVSLHSGGVFGLAPPAKLEDHPDSESAQGQQRERKTGARLRVARKPELLIYCVRSCFIVCWGFVD